MYLTTWEKVTLIIMAIIFVTLSLFTIFFTDVIHFYYDYIEPIKNPEFHKIVDNIYIDFKTENEALIAKQINDCLEYAKLYKNDYYIIITNGNITSEVEYAKGGKAVGLTSPTKKIIRIKDGFLDYALFHEIGHAVDSTYGFTETEEFENLYDKVKPEELFKPQSLDEYMTLDIKEYFAENYKRYIYHELTDKKLITYFDEITKDTTDQSSVFSFLY